MEKIRDGLIIEYQVNESVDGQVQRYYSPIRSQYSSFNNQYIK